MLVQSLSYSLSAGPYIHPSIHSSIPITKSPTILPTNRFICLSLPIFPAIFHQHIHPASSSQLTQPFTINPSTYLNAIHSLPIHRSIDLFIHQPNHPWTSPPSISPPLNALHISPDSHMSPNLPTHLSFICSLPFLPSFQKSTHSLNHQTSSEASCIPGPELRSGEREKFDWFPDVGSLIALGRWVWSSRHGHRPGLFSVVGETVPRGPCESPE